MTDWARLFVSYCQYDVFTVPGASGVGIYVLGDDLVHVGGPHQFTGFCGIHTGWIEARVRVLPAPPTVIDTGWDVISEATLWSPSGRLSVVGLMGGGAEALTDVAVPRGLIRVRVHARDRLHETVRTDGDPPERHELHVWAVSEETPWRTVLADPGGRAWEQKPAKAAEQAMLSLVPRPSNRPAVLRPLPPDPYEDDAGLARVAVVRHRPAPVEVPVGVLPVGDLEVRLERVDGETLTWSWTTADAPIFPEPLTALPDDEPSTVRLTSGPDGVTLRHEGVRGRHAVALGLIWDHLLDGAGSYPWLETLRGQAAEATAQAEKTRRLKAAHDAERWGGPPPPERLRRLPSQAQSLARMDRPLLDRIDALPVARRREAACWAARRAMRVAGLEQIGWIADALAAAEAARPLPRSFTEQGGAAAFRRLLADPEVPHSTVTLRREPTRLGAPHVTEMLQQAAAFPALLALANDDPLVAAIDAVHHAALAHGDDRDRFLADAHTALR
ncbi:hypothetical protein [Micromonospora coxensis]|uniref:Uncharacterized protein n=1 Tax=Micromonospora coxensis TaxID=356852 RepID=A0A1C5JZN2_9ACTN|nr:hypothetical protein [Micromonospora coxensis]SCG76040.1 hypothetical protein GA0070614_5830 [Micromonospora coxensis]